MRLSATRELRYGGKTFASGEQFDASLAHAKLLKAARKATDAPPEPAPDAAADATAVLPEPVVRISASNETPGAGTSEATDADADADGAAAPEAGDDGPITARGGRGRYSRRDMRAADESETGTGG